MMMRRDLRNMDINRYSRQCMHMLYGRSINIRDPSRCCQRSIRQERCARHYTFANRKKYRPATFLYDGKQECKRGESVLSIVGDKINNVHTMSISLKYKHYRYIAERERER